MKTIIAVLLIVFASTLAGAPAKKSSAPTKTQIESAVTAGLHSYLKNNPTRVDQTGHGAKAGTIIVERTAPVAGYGDTWSTSGKVRLLGPTASVTRGFDVRTEYKGGIVRVVDVTLGF